jgi:hypothetical protein
MLCIVLCVLLGIYVAWRIAIPWTYDYGGVRPWNDGPYRTGENIYIKSSGFLYLYRESQGFKEIGEFNYASSMMYYDDAVIVMYETMLHLQNRIHVYDVEANDWWSSRYWKKCTADGELQEHVVRTWEANRLIIYWGCPDDAYRLDVGQRQLVRVDTLPRQKYSGIGETPFGPTGTPPPVRRTPGTFEMPFVYEVAQRFHRLALLIDQAGVWYLTDGKELHPIRKKRVIIPMGPYL